MQSVHSSSGYTVQTLHSDNDSDPKWETGTHRRIQNTKQRANWENASTLPTSAHPSCRPSCATMRFQGTNRQGAPPCGQNGGKQHAKTKKLGCTLCKHMIRNSHPISDYKYRTFKEHPLHSILLAFSPFFKSTTKRHNYPQNQHDTNNEQTILKKFAHRPSATQPRPYGTERNTKFFANPPVREPRFAQPLRIQP